MIPYLPQNSSPEDACKFYLQIIENLEIRSMHHEAWHTHKRDSSVCWICDLLEVSKLVEKEMEALISKSSLDIDEQILVQDINSEEEICLENKYDDYNSECDSEQQGSKVS